MARKGRRATSEDFGLVWDAAPHAQRTFKADANHDNQCHIVRTYVYLRSL